MDNYNTSHHISRCTQPRLEQCLDERRWEALSHRLLPSGGPCRTKKRYVWFNPCRKCALDGTRNISSLEGEVAKPTKPVDIYSYVVSCFRYFTLLQFHVRCWCLCAVAFWTAALLLDKASSACYFGNKWGDGTLSNERHCRCQRQPQEIFTKMSFQGLPKSTRYLWDCGIPSNSRVIKDASDACRGLTFYTTHHNLIWPLINPLSINPLSSCPYLL